MFVWMDGRQNCVYVSLNLAGSLPRSGVCLKQQDLLLPLCGLVCFTFLIVGQMCAYTDQIVSGGVYSKCWQGVFEMVKELVRLCRLGELVGAQPVSCLGEAAQESFQKDQTGIFWTKCCSVTGDWEKYVS